MMGWAQPSPLGFFGPHQGGGVRCAMECLPREAAPLPSAVGFAAMVPAGQANFSLKMARFGPPAPKMGVLSGMPIAPALWGELPYKNAPVRDSKA